MAAPNSGAQQSPEFQPAMRQISVITQSNPVVITTTFAHNYFNGDIVRIIIPAFTGTLVNPSFGMPEINKMYAPITVLSPTTFSMPIDSTNFNPFSIPVGALQFPQCTNMADSNNTIWNSLYNTLPTLIRVDNQPVNG